MLGKVSRKISCAGASNSFIARTDFNVRTFQASVNGSSWADLDSFSELSVLHTPMGGAGASLIITLKDGLPDTRVRLRASSEIGLYFDPNEEINEIDQPNQSYVLYDSNDLIVDPRMARNQDHSENGFDDTSTNEDYKVFFLAADFCLTNNFDQGSIPIGCEGATSSLKARYMTDGGIYEIYVNGAKYPKNSLFRSGEFINYLSSNFNVELKPLDSNGDVVIPNGTYYNNVEVGEFINHSSDYVQIQINTIDASSISQILNNNPSAEWNESTQSLSFCLAPQNNGEQTPTPDSEQRTSDMQLLNILDGWNPNHKQPVLLIDYVVNGVAYQIQDLRGVDTLSSSLKNDVFDVLYKPNAEQGPFMAYMLDSGGIIVRNPTKTNIEFSNFRVTFASLESFKATADHNNFSIDNVTGGTTLAGIGSIEMYKEGNVTRLKGILGTVDMVDWDNLSFL